MSRPLPFLGVATQVKRRAVALPSCVLCYACARSPFARFYWNLTELKVLTTSQKMILPSCEVDIAFSISMGDETAIGASEMDPHERCVHVRLLSHRRSSGQLHRSDLRHGRFKRQAEPKPSELPTADAVLLHCHGGGFIAQSSASHEAYLREWAKELGVPIISIDYSLAPEARFPLALQECLFVYEWLQQPEHHRSIGSTCEVRLPCRLLSSSLRTRACCVSPVLLAAMRH